MAQGRHLHSADLALWETWESACSQVEEWLINRRQVGVYSARTSEGKFEQQLCPIRQLPKAPAQSPQSFEPPEAYSLC